MNRYLLHFLAFMVLTPSTALADQWWVAVGYRCLEDPGHFIAYPVPYDANGRIPASREGLFVQQWIEDPHRKSTIATCTIGGNSYVLQRVYQNRPRPSGGFCAGANWARYLLHRGEVLVADFSMGCSRSPALAVSPNHSTSLCSERGCVFAHSDSDLPLIGSLGGSVSKGGQ